MSPSRRRILFATVCGALLVGALAYVFWPRPVPVDLGEVTRGAVQVTVGDEGRTRVKEVYVVSAPITGRARRIDIHVGDPVVADETLLATIQETAPTFLDVRSKAQAQAEVKAAEAARALAQAEVTRAKAELEFANTDLNRAEVLAARGNISQRALDRAELEVKIREAALATAEASLRVRNYELETALAALIEPGERATLTDVESQCCVEVRAPVSGRVLKVLHESEGVVAAGTPLIEIGDPRDLEVEVDLLSSDAVNVVEGADVEIVRWGGGEMLAGRVRRVEPYGFTKVSALGIEEQRVNVIIDFTDPPENWLPLGHGYRVETRIIVWRSDDVLKLPLSALFRDGESWAVFVLDDGRARLRYVDVGRTNSLEAQVLDGLDEGEQVVLYPSDRVFDDVRIVARPPG